MKQDLRANSLRFAFHFIAFFFLSSTIGCGGCRQSYREDLDYSYNVQQTWEMDDLNYGEIIQFESVFWEPDDTVSLRKKILDDRIAASRDVLEIGCGTGLISILCLQNDAKSVVATDINPAAVANTQYNVAMLAPDEKLDVRQVEVDSPSAFAVIKPGEKFDLIISNPPWEDGVVAKPGDHAFYDPGFELMDSLLDGLPQHLKPGGRCLLAYGHVPAIERLLEEAKKRQFEFKVLDDRELSSLEKDFLPGMLVEIRTPLNVNKQKVGSDGKFTNPQDDTCDPLSGAETKPLEPNDIEP
jgi:tRNA1(Val) A37 N6-methylase TrmN6